MLVSVQVSMAVTPLADFTELVDKSSPAVVSIVTLNNLEKKQKLVPDEFRDELESTPLMDVLEEMFGDQLEDKLYGRNDPGLGSGSILTTDGFIITNYHVIDGAKEIFVQLKSRDEYPAEVIGYDIGTDLALLKIKADGLPIIKFADDPVQVGQWVVAIGAPYGFEDTLTVGVVSAKRRSLGTEKYVPFIQTDVAINPGNSGGPLLNLNGEMVGINAQIVSESGSYAGLSFAVPSDIIKNVITQLKSQGFVERGWLGLAFQDLNRDLAKSFGMRNPKGALVSKVIPQSPAQKAGLQIGDIIVAMNSKDIRKATDVPPVVGLLPIGSEIKVDIVRDQQMKKLSIIIERSPNQTMKMNMAMNLPRSLPAHGGITVRDLNPIQDDDISEGITGVVVVRLESLPWKSSGLRTGDVIMRLDKQNITSTKQFYSVLNALPKSEHFSMLITRGGQIQRYIAVRIPN